MHASMYACVYAYICMNVGMRAYMHENYTYVCSQTYVYNIKCSQMQTPVYSGGSRGRAPGARAPLTKIFFKNKKVKFEKN